MQDHILWEIKIKIGAVRIDTILSGPILKYLCQELRDFLGESS